MKCAPLCLALFALSGCAAVELPDEVDGGEAALPPVIGGPEAPADDGDEAPPADPPAQAPPTDPPEEMPPADPPDEMEVPPEADPPEDPPPEDPPEDPPPEEDPEEPPPEDPPEMPVEDPPPADEPPAGLGDCGGGGGAAMIARINALRDDAGVGRLQCIAAAVQAARAHADDMCNRDYFAVNSPDGTEPFDRIDNAGFTPTSMFTVLAGGTDDLDRIMNAWSDDGPTREALTDGDFDYIGVGHNPCGRDQYWVAYVVAN